MNKMNVTIANIEVDLNGEKRAVNLRWFRGASRYNNGGNHGGRILKPKYPLRIIFGRIKDAHKWASIKSN
jgi:hypothetical protein